MKFLTPSVLVAGISILLTACEGTAKMPGMPGCGDAMTQNGARMAIENSYVSAGMQGLEKPSVDMLPNLKEYIDEAVTRNFVRIFKLRSADDIRMCRAEIASNIFLLVVVARNPKSLGEFGYVAYNIGLPENLIVGEGWLND